MRRFTSSLLVCGYSSPHQQLYCTFACCRPARQTTFAYPTTLSFRKPRGTRHSEPLANRSVATAVNPIPIDTGPNLTRTHTRECSDPQEALSGRNSIDYRRDGVPNVLIFEPLLRCSRTDEHNAAGFISGLNHDAAQCIAQLLFIRTAISFRG